MALPAPNVSLPRDPPAIVRALSQDERALGAALARWDGAGRPPLAVTLLALHRQRILRYVGARPKLADAVARLDPAERDDVRARVDLTRLAGATKLLRARIRVGPAPPASRLLLWYRLAQRRFGVRWQLLAAVNFVESGFGKIRNTSVAGARGPMQFEPATWRQYGLGGDVDDPHDAILGAANYLRASGATRDERGALLHYNHSPLYGDAVLRYTRRIARDPDAFLEYYAWQIFVRTPTGDHRVTGPGL